MKASLSLATILLAAGISGANAQNEFAIANHAGTNPSSSIKDQRIAQLEAEIAALKAELASLKGETAGSAERFTEPVPITPEAAAIVESSDLTYTVQPGDNLYKIARKTKSRASAIAAVNDMAMDVIIRPGQVLKLPASATVATAIAVCSDYGWSTGRIMIKKRLDPHYTLTNVTFHADSNFAIRLFSRLRRSRRVPRTLPIYGCPSASP